MDAIMLLQLGPEFPLSDVWGSTVGFVAVMVAFVGMIGLGSRNLSVGALGAYMMFAYYASESGVVLLETILYATLILVILGMSFKLWRLEGVGDI